MKLVYIFAVVAGLSSCDSEIKKDSIDSLDSKSTFQINGMKPSKFYNQFIYNTTTVKNKETNEETNYFHYLTFSQSKAELLNGRFADIEIAMYKDGKYAYKYSEWKKDADQSYGNDSYLGVLSRAGIGTWKVKETKLIFDNLGDASGLMVQGNGFFLIDDADDDENKDKERPAISLSFSKDLVSKGLKGSVKVLTMSSIWTSNGKSPVDGWSDSDTGTSGNTDGSTDGTAARDTTTEDTTSVDHSFLKELGDHGFSITFNTDSIISGLSKTIGAASYDVMYMQSGSIVTQADVNSQDGKSFCYFGANSFITKNIPLVGNKSNVYDKSYFGTAHIELRNLDSGLTVICENVGIPVMTTTDLNEIFGKHASLEIQ